MLVSRSVSLVTQKKHKGVANQIIKEHRQIIKKHMKKTKINLTNKSIKQSIKSFWLKNIIQNACNESSYTENADIVIL